MAKLFVFGVGGTGARVMRSLTMLLATGVRSNFSEIVPIIVDPDRASGDLNRTVGILKTYQNIQRELSDYEHNLFFKTSLLTLSEVIARKGGNSNVIDGFRYELQGVQNEKFKDFIGYSSMDPANKWLTSLLFSEQNLDSSLEVGFKGNPNIGSVVLNKFTKSEAFEAFARNFEQGDRVFIISSIFGGTGAAGFPLLLKNMREGVVNGEHYSFLKEAPIGAITVQPYFRVAGDEESEIDSNSFVSKTKAALHYYHKNISGNRSINALYYIGDVVKGEYENNEGGSEQINRAHFVELAAALAVIDFANLDESLLQTSDGKAMSPTYRELGIRKKDERINFSNFHLATNRLFRTELTAYFYFNLYLKEKLKSGLNHPYASVGSKIDQNFLTQNFYKNLSDFNLAFRVWLGEMATNHIAFTPFNVDVEHNKTGAVTDIHVKTGSIFTLVNDVKEKKGWMASVPGLAKNNYELFIAALNSAAQKVGDTTVNKRFMGVFSKATTELVNDKLFSNE